MTGLAVHAGISRADCAVSVAGRERRTERSLRRDNLLQTRCRVLMAGSKRNQERGACSDSTIKGASDYPNCVVAEFHSL